MTNLQSTQCRLQFDNVITMLRLVEFDAQFQRKARVETLIRFFDGESSRIGSVICIPFSSRAVHFARETAFG